MVWTSLLSVVTIICRSGMVSVVATVPDTRWRTALSVTFSPDCQEVELVSGEKVWQEEGTSL